MYHFTPQVMSAADGGDMATPGELEPGASLQVSSMPVTSLSWSPDREGLLAATAFDQTIRVCVVKGS